MTLVIAQGSHATWKVLENHFGPGMSWKNILENYALRHFCSEFLRLGLFQISNFLGLCPGPRWGAYSAPPDP